MKKVHVKSALPIYIAAAVWIAVGLIRPQLMLKLHTIIIVAVMSAVACVVSKKFFPGRTIEIREKIKTGDASLDADIEAGFTRLESLKKANIAIDDAGISANLDRMTAAGDQIFRELAKDKRKLSLVRRFMNYYLPTAEKLMAQYQQLMKADTKGENVISAMHSIENSLNMIADAFEKCLDNLYADQEMDIDAEIQVMKTMLASDGLFSNAAGISQNEKNKENRPMTSGGI